SLRIVAPCTGEMIGWVRYARGSEAGDEILKLDVDLCDERGNLCVQMRGLNWERASLDRAEAVVAQANLPAARKEIALGKYEQAIPAPVAQKKPAGISLVEPHALVLEESVSWQRATARPKVSITLSQATPGWSVPGSEGAGVSSIRLLDCGSGIFSIHIAASNPARNAIAGLLQALARVQQEGSIKVLMLSGIEHCFPGGGREAYNEAVEQGLYRAIVSFPYPVIAVVKDDAIGAGFMAATLCDLMVLNEDASYGCTDGQRHFYPTGGEAMLFSERLGDVLAQDFLYVSPVATGRQLRAKGWTCPMAAGE